MTVAAPPGPPRRDDPEALFEEARRHGRHRRLRFVAIVLLALAAAVGAYGAINGNRHLPTFLGGGRAADAHANRAVVLLVDISGSMRSTDVKPTRLGATVAGLGAFLDRLPKGVEVGVVSFSTKAEVVQAPTRDRRVVLHALGSLAPEAGTALGDGLTAAVKLAVDSLEREGIRREPGHYLPAAIVLESDGAQNRGMVTPLQAAKRAKAAGIRVYGVALGKPDGAVEFGFGVHQSSIPVPPDPQTVESVSSVTGGEAFTARTADRLDAIYRELGSTIGR